VQALGLGQLLGQTSVLAQDPALVLGMILLEPGDWGGLNRQ